MQRGLSALLLLCVLLLTACQIPSGMAQQRRSNTALVPTASITTYEVAPHDTDAAIDQWLEPHLALLDRTVTSRGQLFLFFPGSFGKPQNQSLILQQAAEQGFHAIGLRYPNTWTVNNLCDSTANPDCYGDVRREILTGSDSSSLVTITQPNSIENRLVKLLRYLDLQYPEQGWGHYLDNTGQPLWSAIVVSGHSQGGGHAAFIAQRHVVARVCMFSSPADTFTTRGQLVLATWLSQPTLTPPSAYYGLVSELESGYLVMVASWQALGMANFGVSQQIDSTTPPYANSHMLTTRLTPAQPGEYHGSTVVDRNTPKLADGTPALAPAWQYLCFAPQERAQNSIVLPLIQRI